MEWAEAEEQVQVLIVQLGMALQTEEEARRTIAGITRILEGYRELFPEMKDLVEEAIFRVPTHPEDQRDRPRGAEAVRLILQDSPNSWFRVSQLVGLLKDRGWLPESENPANAIRAALERLVANPDESDVVRGKHTTTGAVLYKYDPDRDRTPPDTGGYGFDEEPF